MTILTAAELAEIRRDFADESLGGPSHACLHVMVDRLLSHISSLSPSAPGVEQSDHVLIQRIECLKTWAGYLHKRERDETFDMIIARLRSRLAAPAGDGWIECSERMPNRDGYYEVASSEPYPPQVYILECRDTAWPEHAHWLANGDFHGHVTHWREPSAPPSVAKGE